MSTCFVFSSSSSLELIPNGDVYYYFTTNSCTGPEFTLPSNGACQSFALAQDSYSLGIPPGTYVQFSQYSDNNCSIPSVPYVSYFSVDACLLSTTGSVIYTYHQISNGTTITTQSYTSSDCSGTFTPLTISAGCGLTQSGSAFFEVVTFTDVTTSQLSTSQIITSQVITSQSSTAQFSTDQSSPANEAILFYPSFIILVIALVFSSLF